MAAPLDYEERGWSSGLRVVVGIDEAGLGPVAGPVVVGAVALHRGQQFEGCTDSKQVSPTRREELARLIRAQSLAWRVAAASTREIERLNVRAASIVAMRRALDRLSLEADLVLVDGNPVPELGEHQSIVGGDRASHSIACASILAKVTRDRLMRRLHARYPLYGWASNKGYRTRDHMEAIRRHGPTPHHRVTFQGVLQTELDLDPAS
ncbi:ribonuclease HII [Candidatus Palauibacter sp.]|uniref:ribonuclease HII n=1 Tax=Candidatus Palauibacter sp. TaxID=3101350 RepID=UPI003AF1F977